MVEQVCTPHKSQYPGLVHFGPVPEPLEVTFCGMVVTESKFRGKVVTMVNGMPWREFRKSRESEFRKSREPKGVISICGGDGPVFIAATCSKPESKEQSRVVRAILASKENCIVQGRPGSGKTATACRLVHKARHSADTITLALAALAARHLPSGRVGDKVFEPTPFARLPLGFAEAVVAAAKKSDKPEFLLICDEFSMIESKVYSTIVALQNQLIGLGKVARVILFGDVNQLGPPVGGTFAATPVAVSPKTDIFRLTHSWRFQDHRLAALIDAMEARDWHAALPYFRLMQSKPEGRPDDGCTLRHFALTNAMVDKLNDREEQAAIKSGAECVTFASKAGDKLFVAGVEYRLTRNKFVDGEYYYVNGTIGSVDFKNVPRGTTAVGKGTLLPFRTTDGVLLNVGPRQVGSKYTYDGVIRANVANTVHNAQGMTCPLNGDHYNVWLAGAKDFRLLYVAISRFRRFSQVSWRGVDLAVIKDLWAACPCGCYAESARRARSQLPPSQCNQKRKRQIEDLEKRLECNAQIVPVNCDCSKRPRKA